MQDFKADLFVADPGNLGGWALADALQIPKAILQVPGFHPPMVRYRANSYVVHCSAKQSLHQLLYVVKAQFSIHTLPVMPRFADTKG